MDARPFLQDLLMADEEVTVDESFPIFESIDTLHTRSVSTPSTPDNVVVDDIEVETSGQETQQKRRRGRPKGSKNRPGGSLPIGQGESTNVSGRLAKDVSLRTQQVLKGASSIPAIWRPAFQMHDIEATNIADPLASYATRQAELSPIVAKLIDDFDLVAAIIGIGAYAVRVYKENGEWIEQHADEQRRASRTRQAPMGNGRESIPQSQSAQRPQTQPENRDVDTQPATEYNQDVPPISIPYIGNL